MTIRTCLVLAGVLSVLSPARAVTQQKDAPRVLLVGLQVYKAQGAAAAVKAWLVDSPASDDAEMISNTVAALNKIQAAYGKLVGYEVLQSSLIGSRAARNYLILLYERGPLYAHFDTYRTSKDSVVTGFLFNTKPDEILPRSLLERGP